jgi:hypothetical protein
MFGVPTGAELETGIGATGAAVAAGTGCGITALCGAGAATTGGAVAAGAKGFQKLLVAGTGVAAGGSEYTGGA